MTRLVRSFAAWVRAGYPDDAPRTGHSPLLALMGPVSLTRHQLQRITAALPPGETDAVAIGAAILEVTGHLPHDGQIHAVRRAATRPGR